VKRILVIDGAGSSLHEVAIILEEVNARVLLCTPDEAGEVMKRESPDLVVLHESDLGDFPASEAGRTRIVLSGEVPAGGVLRSREGRDLIRVGPPPERESFLELTRRALSVPERRTLRAPIKIADKKVGRDYPGSSEDFSLTGMAFRTTGILARDDEIAVSLEEEGRGSLRLEARIVRSAPGGPGEETLYGAFFLNLRPTLKHALERFVWRIRRRAS
jgi:hypothetical protein